MSQGGTSEADATEPPVDAGNRRQRALLGLGTNVVALAAVSFFTDLSSEMIYPLLPLFLTGTLGATAATVGVIEGAAESTASLLKLVSGWWSDRVRRRKPLVLWGYGLASLARPLVAVAGGAGQVLVIRLVDRVGKGIRSSPRDALIADSVDPAVRGRAFGFHRAADHAGAVAGPLAAFALLQWGDVPIRVVFALAAVPAVAAMAVLLFRVHEPRLAPAAGAGASSSPAIDVAGGAPQRQDGSMARAGSHPIAADGRDSPPARPPGSAALVGAALPRRFWGFLGAVIAFTLGNSTDAFLLLRASQLGVAAPLIPVLWATLHVVKSASSTPGGALSDRLGRRPLIIAGWLLYALVYLGFAAARAPWHAWALFAVYGLYFGLTEGTEKALVADLVAPARRGQAFGWYNLAIGLGALPASLLFGWLWDRSGPRLAFTVGAGFALAATAAIALVAPGRGAAGGDRPG